MDLDSSYLLVLDDIKKRIKASQYKAILHINQEMILLYWSIGNTIQQNSTWGNKFIESLAKDIKMEFPNVSGFSLRNLKYMKKFYSLFPEIEIVQAPLAQLTWYHLIALMDKTQNIEEYIWYAEKALENGWSRNTLVHQIELNLFKRQELSKKTNNFKALLPSLQNELAQQTMKDPYIFDFINLTEDMKEKDIETELVKNITKLLLEFGNGFSFVGNQYHLEIGGEDFYLDLLFYHLNLRCYFVIELKTGSFRPEYAGKLNFYLSAVDSLLKKEGDNSSIGLLLCKEKNKVVAEYSLRDMTKPIGISEYKLINTLPSELSLSLPSTDIIESRIDLLTDEKEK